MAKLTKILGLNKLKLAVNKHSEELGYKSSLALRVVGLWLQRASQLLVPVEFGDLKGSAFTRYEGDGWDTVVRVGYTKEYAVYVHENMIAHHDIGQAKYLQEPAETRRREMAALYKKEMG